MPGSFSPSFSTLATTKQNRNHHHKSSSSSSPSSSHSDSALLHISTNNVKQQQNNQQRPVSVPPAIFPVLVGRQSRGRPRLQLWFGAFYRRRRAVVGGLLALLAAENGRCAISGRKWGGNWRPKKQPTLNH
uniref:Uncharacterized protein n=1 Tax=Globodera pallida TaxID=36090 RepID=A0A183CH70_GLOPA